VKVDYLQYPYPLSLSSLFASVTAPGYTLCKDAQ
jgi:hypothetical protein